MATATAHASARPHVQLEFATWWQRVVLRMTAAVEASVLRAVERRPDPRVTARHVDMRADAVAMAHTGILPR